MSYLRETKNLWIGMAAVSFAIICARYNWPFLLQLLPGAAIGWIAAKADWCDNHSEVKNESPF